VIPRADLARTLAPTYAKAAQVDEEEAEDRLLRAFGNQRVLDEIYAGLSAALAEAKGPRTSEDELIDKLSAGMQARKRRVRAAELTPAVSAVLVLVNVELGQAPEMMREAIQGGKGRALLEEGLKALGAHLAKELIR
jgi:16S rRNA C1402 N4-methylase RsmH